MNYLPFVSWGMYGGTSAKERANFFASWGLIANLQAAAGSLIGAAMYYYRKMCG